MSDQPADLSHDLDDVNLDAGVTAAGTAKVESPSLAPGQGDGGIGAKSAAPKETMSPSVSKLMIMAPQRERSWEDFVNSEPHVEPPHIEATHHRHASAVVAVIALAAITGIVGGSFATAGIGRLLGPETAATAPASQALQDHIARLDAEIVALKGEGERAAKQSASARAKFAERLDRIEKAQAEPAAKLAKLSESVEKLRAAPPTVVAAATPAPVAAATPAPAPAAVASLPSKDITGSINNAPVPTPAPKPEVARLPLVDGWRLLDVAQGGATIESRGEVFEVYAGDPVPGLGRVDAIRKQDGRWTVITTRGLIVAR
ncbi:MAG: hypothetical protein ABW213_16640 [Tardiphaga sp.]